MSRNIYIASSLKNYSRVLQLRDKLVERGFTITYDWAQAWKEAVESGNTRESDEQLRLVAQMEYAAVCDCSTLLCVLPSGRGGHFELGAAYALGKNIVILDETSGADKIAFHTMPAIRVHNKEEDAIKDVERLSR